MFLVLLLNGVLREYLGHIVWWVALIQVEMEIIILTSVFCFWERTSFVHIRLRIELRWNDFVHTRIVVFLVLSRVPLYARLAWKIKHLGLNNWEHSLVHFFVKSLIRRSSGRLQYVFIWCRFLLILLSQFRRLCIEFDLNFHETFRAFCGRLARVFTFRRDLLRLLEEVAYRLKWNICFTWFACSITHWILKGCGGIDGLQHSLS